MLRRLKRALVRWIYQVTLTLLKFLIILFVGVIIGINLQ